MGSNYYKTYLFIIAIMVAVYLVLIFSGRANLGHSTAIVLASVLVAIRMHWDLKKRWWLWATALAIFSLNVPLLLWFRWPHSYVPPIALLPFGVAECFITSKAIDLAEKIATRPASSGGDSRY